MGGAKPPGPYVEAAGIVIISGGYKRPSLDVAREFVREQSLGEWGDVVEEADAQKLAELLSAWDRHHGGPVIAPLAFGGNTCLCDKGTEEWCRAAMCPRSPIGPLAQTDTRRTEG